MKLPLKIFLLLWDFRSPRDLINNSEGGCDCFRGRAEPCRITIVEMNTPKHRGEVLICISNNDMIIFNVSPSMHSVVSVHGPVVPEKSTPFWWHLVRGMWHKQEVTCQI